ncbi:MAG: EAL domain-containing protein, partial [Lachnospiraceae bacterium]|nr:EAL domain-containing protein [Lachnospiraceae bacterium]
MLYYHQYCVAAVAATCMLIAMYFLKQNYSTRQNKLFLLLLTVNLFASGINITTFHTISFPQKYPLWVDYLSNQTYLFLFNLMAVLFLLYVDSMTKIPGMKLPVRIVAVFFTGLEALLLLTSPLTHLVIYFDESHVYRHGSLMILLYVFAFLSLALADGMFIYSHKKFNFYQVLSITGFVGVIFASVIFQVFFPAYVINNFSCSMMMFFLYSAFENPAYYAYKDTRCYNRRAFLATVQKYRKRKKVYTVVAMKVTDYDYTRHNLGQSKVEILSSKIAERLNFKFGKNAYCISDNCFVVLTEGDREGSQTAQRLKESFEEPFEIGLAETSIRITANVAVRVIPIRFPDVGGAEMEEIIHYLLNMTDEEKAGALDIELLVEKLHRNETIAHIIDRAIQNNGFSVYYQPILNVRTGEFSSSEALIRLIDEELGFISPEEF